MTKVSKYSVEKPQLSSGFANKELDKVEKQFDANEVVLSNLNPDSLSKSPIFLEEPQTKISKKEIEKFDAPVIKSTKRFVMPIPKSGYEKEKYEKLINEDEEFIRVICENNELIGEKIELWAGNYPGQELGFYEVPVNIPVYVPRKVAKSIKRCKYHRIKTCQRPINVLQQEMSSGVTCSGPIEYLTVTETKQRLDVRLANIGNDF